MREHHQAATLGFGLGLPLGALGVWNTDPNTASVALAAGFGLVALVIFARKAQPGHNRPS